MNIGENIQKLRKEMGLSQEELGQKILVSRQTVSQWETGQTVPSIDNLVLLKEIFGVSVDGILGEEKTVIKKEDHTAKEAESSEKYTVKLSKDELKDVYRTQVKNYFLLPFILDIAILGVYLLYVCFLSSISDIAAGIILGFFLLLIIIILFRFLAYRKSWQRSFMKIYESTYEYSLFDGFFITDIYRQGEKIFSRKAFYSDIEKIEQSGKWIFFQLGNQLFILKRNELQKDSIFITDIYNKKAGFNGKPFSQKNSLIKKLLIILILLILTGTPLIINKYNSSDPAENFALLTEITLPAPSVMETNDLTNEKTVLRGYMLYEDNLTFDEDSAKELERDLKADSRWLESLPDELLGLTAGLTEIYLKDMDFDYILVFNSTLNQFNTVPDESGIYYCLNALYDCETNNLKILEYHMDYVK